MSGDPGQLQTSLSTASIVRVNQPGTTVVISYANIGDTDIPAPLLTVTATNALLALPGQSFVSSTIQVLGINEDGPAGTLPPGYHGTLTLDYQPITYYSGSQFDFNLYLPAAPATPINWSSQEASLQPSYISSQAWSAIWGNFATMVGSTAGQFQTFLDQLATYFSEIGTPTSDVNTLYQFAIELADASIPVTAAIGNVDAAVTTPGVPLNFARTYQQSISGRYQIGPLGRGWVDSWQISATTDSQGDVTIDEAGVLLYFARQGNGTYLDPPGNDYVLTVAGGSYQVRETTGTIIAFNPDGTFQYMQDANGNRITAGYTNGNMTSLTDSNGAFLTLGYNSQGLISTITDSTGQVTTYTYDSTDELLLSVSNPEETEQYTYITSGSAAQQYALASITNADGTQVYLGYDLEGRLISQQGCLCPSNPIEHLVYTYGTGGTVGTTDNTGDTSVVMYNAFGEAAMSQDALGEITRNYYDSSGDLLKTVLPDGGDYTYSYDAQGNLLTETNPLGETDSFTSDANNNLVTSTDPNGNVTSYAHTNGNDLASLTDANGAEEQYAYNSLGEVTSFLSANGATIGYVYNQAGQVTQETFADGTTYDYTYDQYGNCTSATDAVGNVTTFIYAGANDGDPTNPYLLSEVMYPDGTYLKFFYNSGGQLVQTVDQTGFEVNYAYDDAGRLSELTDADGDLIVKYTYDADGRLSERDNGNGTFTVYTYDGDADVLSITNYAPSAGPTTYVAAHSTVNSFDDYTYDALGNVLTDTSQDGEWTYAYDADIQLIQAIFTSNSTDPDGLTAQDLQYVYDADGNRSSETVNGVTTTYTVNNLNQYTSSMTNGVTTSYQYDAGGNLVAQNSGSGTNYTYRYNELNQVTAMSGPNLSVANAYDPFGDLVSQTVNGTTTNFQVESSGVVAVSNGSGAVTAHFTYGLGLTSQVSANGAASYYDFNNIGSTVGITSANGTYLNQYAYLPSGQTSTLAAALPNPFTFVGQLGVMSQQSGLDLMHDRNYVVSLGRFQARPHWYRGGDRSLHLRWQ